MGFEPGCQSAYHGQSCCCTQPILFLPPATAKGDQAVTDAGCNKDSRACFLSAIDWTTATAYWLVSAANCYKGSKSSRTLKVRLVTGARRSEHMTPILRDLHWLSVRRRITFKIAVLVYKCLHDMVPQYLQTYCEPTSTVASWRLRSTHSGRLTVPRTRTNYGDRSFAVQGPRVWNSLPAAL